MHSILDLVPATRTIDNITNRITFNYEFNNMTYSPEIYIKLELPAIFHPYINKDVDKAIDRHVDKAINEDEDKINFVHWINSISYAIINEFILSIVDSETGNIILQSSRNGESLLLLDMLGDGENSSSFYDQEKIILASGKPQEY